MAEMATDTDNQRQITLRLGVRYTLHEQRGWRYGRRLYVARKSTVLIDSTDHAKSWNNFVIDCRRALFFTSGQDKRTVRRRNLVTVPDGAQVCSEVQVCSQSYGSHCSFSVVGNCAAGGVRVHRKKTG